MGRHVDLLRALPRTERDVAARAADKSPEVVRIARQFGREYFDGDRKYGYGGYWYDGRWGPVAADILTMYFPAHEWPAPGSLGAAAPRVLDIGCAKGFLVHGLVEAGADAYGIDISRYAVVESPFPRAVGRLHHGSAVALPFPDNSFDLVISLDTIHNLPRERAGIALREIVRVSRGPAFVKVDAYQTEEERQRLEQWVLTAEYWGSADEWLELFAESGYEGDYAWTTV